MSFFKITDPNVIAAHRQFLADNERVQAEAHAFALHYPGSVPVFKSDMSGRSFFGLRFEQANDSPLWTKPQREAGYTQRPRAVPAKGAKGQERLDQLGALTELRAEWESRFPAFEAKRVEMWAHMGLNVADFLFCGGFQFFVHEDALYCSTPMTPRDGWHEILGSEYERAKKAAECAEPAKVAA